MKLPVFAIICALLYAIAFTARADFQGSTHLMPFDEAPIQYSNAHPSGRIAQLQEAIERGEIKLTFDSDYGYLPSLLKALNISVTSQMLVFSKSSFQRELISTHHAARSLLQ